MMDDQAHALRIPWRSLSTLQAIATKGCFGKQLGKLKPFEKLKVAELRKELKARNVFSIDGRRPELQQQLVKELRGVQRVPSLLLLHPEQPLAQLNLQHYTVLDCEPLHDVKGHLLNLFQELPYLVPTKCENDIKALIKANLSGDKITGADLRATVIYAYLLLTGKGITGPVTQLLHSIIKVSEILYSDDSHRSPRRVLQLRNQVWLHHELCYSLVAIPQATSRIRFFGIYLHALSRHAADQYEVVCQKSINAEHQERLFGQARTTASTTTNRHPSNVIPSVLLRLQAKQESGRVLQAVNIATSKVERAAANVPKHKGTTISTAFICQHLKSWQAHLEQISPFLMEDGGIKQKMATSLLMERTTRIVTLRVHNSITLDLTLWMMCKAERGRVGKQSWTTMFPYQLP